MIEIKAVTKRYGAKVAIEQVNAAIPDKSIFGLVGINGSGKSTLLRVMAGVFQSDEGAVFYDGEPIFDNENRKRDILFIPDEPYFSGNTTGRMMAELYKTFYDFDEGLFKEYTSAFQVNPHGSLRTFSKGMRRRMFVCLAFASNPKYLLMDEVFDGLDPAARYLFCNGLEATMDRTGGTAVIASHSLRELEDISTAYGIIDKNRMSFGVKDAVKDAPKSICKFQVAFQNPLIKEKLPFEVVKFESTGKIATITMRGNSLECRQKIESLNPLVIDEVPVNFEEFFLSETMGGGR